MTCHQALSFISYYHKVSFHDPSLYFSWHEHGWICRVLFRIHLGASRTSRPFFKCLVFGQVKAVALQALESVRGIAAYLKNDSLYRYSSHSMVWLDTAHNKSCGIKERKAHTHTHTSRATWPKRHTSRSTAPTSNDWMCLALARYHCRRWFFCSAVWTRVWIGACRWKQ